MAAQPDTLHFLQGGGETGALTRAFPWEENALGRPQDWPAELKTLVGVMLGSNQPMFTAWGPARIMLYNDGYAELCRDRHPAALGAPFARVWWDIMEEVGPILDRAYAGQSTHMDDIQFALTRDGHPQEAHFAFSYTPVRDAAGRVGGMFCACRETTAQVLAERRLSAEGDRLSRLFAQAPGFMALLEGPEYRITLANPAYLKLVGHREVLGRTVVEALPDAVEQGYLTLLDQVYRSGKAFASNGARYAVQAVPGGPIDERFMDFVYQPVVDALGRVTGIFVEGADVTDRALAETRRAALLKLDERLRDLSDATEAAFVSAETLGHALGACRVGYGVIDAEAGTIRIERDWAAPGFESAAGLHRFRDYGAYFAELKRGEPVAIADVTADSRTADDPSALLAFGIKALLDVPLAEQGSTIAQIFVHSPAPRAWTAEEIAFVRDFAQRTRAAVERRRAERESRERERELRLLTDALPVLVSYVDREGRYRFNNKAYEDWFGHAREEVAGRHMRDVLGEDAFERLRPNIEAALAGETVAFDAAVPYKDGGARDIEASYIPRRAADGSADGFYVLVADVSARKTAEEALRQSREELQLLTDTMPALVTYMAAEAGELRYRFVNKRYEEWFGRPLAAVKDRPVREVIGEAAYEGVKPWIDRALGGERVSFEQFMPYKNAPPRHIHVEYVPRLSQDGQVEGIYALVQDISEAKRAEARLRESEARLRLVVEGARDHAIFTTDPDGAITTWSAGAEDIFGWSAEEAVGRSAAIVFTPEDRAAGAVERELNTAAREGCANDERWHIRKDGGRVFMNGSVRPLPPDALGRAQGFLKIARDETERRRADEALRTSEARFRFLDALARETAKQADADAILATTTRMVGEHLGVSICAYADMDADEDGFTIRGDWSAPGSPSIVGHYSLADFGRLAVKNLGAGLPLIINDNLAELAPEEAATFQNIGISATICMPLVKEGRLTALMAIHDKAPRIWSDSELSVIREVTERSWAHVERVGAVAALRASEERFRALAAEQAAILGQLAEGVIVTDAEGRITFVNEAAARIHGVKRLDVAPEGYSEAYRLFTEDGKPYPSEELPLARTVRTGAALSDERWRIRAPDGREVVAVGNARPVLGEDGQRIGNVLTLRDETARLTAEAQLRELNADLERQVVERARERGRTWQVSPDLLCIFENDGRFYAVNPAWSATLGWTQDELVGALYSELLHPEDADRTLKTLEALQGDLPVLRFNNRFRSKDGSWRWLSWVAVPEAGKFYCSARDITEEKAQAEALAERTAERDRMWELSPDLLTVVDYEGRLLRVNPSWTRVLGYDEETLLTRPYVEILHPDEIASIAALLAEMRAAERPVLLEDRLLAADGTWRSFVWTLSPEPGGERLYGVGRDVTEERAQAQALAARTAERDRLWTLSADMLARADYTGMMSAVSPAWTRVLGFSETELLTRPYSDFMHPDDTGATLAALTRMGETGAPTRFENRILTSAGDYKPIEWTVAPEPDGVNFIAVGRDLSDAKARERELAQTQEALRQSQKMEAVGQLTGGIAHDFNNMLAVVIGGLSMLSRKLARGDTDVGRYVEGAMEGATRAAALTQRLLAFSRQQPLSPEPLDANGMVESMTELLSRSLGETVAVETRLASGLWTVRADRGQLENAVLNLALNARDAMPDGGTVLIATANLDAAEAAQHALEPRPHVMVAVSDTGGGMSAEVKAKAFDPFFTTKGVGKGTGLGLSQVFGFIRQSGGHVEIDSAPGQGTTVRLFLPRFAGAATGAARGSAPVSARGGRADEIVLVVEDEERVRALSVDALGELGYAVVEAGNAAEALQLIENGQKVSLLFTDIVMPDMAGTELAARARRARPDLKVLFATGYAREGSAPDQGAADILRKPFSLNELAAKVRAALDGSHAQARGEDQGS